MSEYKEPSFLRLAWYHFRQSPFGLFLVVIGLGVVAFYVGKLLRWIGWMEK